MKAADDDLSERARMLEALEHVAASGVPGPGSAAAIDIGSGAYLAYLRGEVVEGFVTAGGSTCRFFEGAYGAGKSHLLSLLHEMALDLGMAVVKTDLSQAIRLEDWRLITAYVLQNLECRIDGQMCRSLAHVLQALGESGRAKMMRFSDTRLPHPGFKHAMRAGLHLSDMHRDGAILVRRFLEGDRVRVSDLRSHQLQGIRDYLSLRNAEHVLTTVLGGLFALGIPGTVLLFDENERTFTFRHGHPPAAVRSGANLMRRLIDGCFTGSLVGTLAIFAVLPNFMEASALAYPALGQRIAVPPNVAGHRAWRWPTLPISLVSDAHAEDDFLRAAVDRFGRIALDFGVHDANLRKQLLAAGSQVLNENVGTGFRRPLMKKLASLTLAAIDAMGA
jgi:hypothetical protein